MRSKPSRLARAVVLVGVLSASAATNSAPPPTIAVPALGEIRVLDLGDGEPVEFAWWPPGQGPRANASVRRIGPQPGLWTGCMEWRAVGPMAAVTKEGAWVARGALTAPQRARILWPGAPATTPVEMAVAWLNARVMGGGFALVPGGGDVLVRQCGAEAGWQQVALETRAVELGDGLRLEMQGLSEGFPDGGFWAAREALSAAQQALILPRGASGTHASLAAVVLWLNRGVAGGGFALAEWDGGWLVRHSTIGAGWQCVELERTVTLGGDVQLELVWCPPGTFVMGSPGGERGRNEDEQQHPVALTKGFWMGTYEVTQAQWKRVMGKTPSNFKGYKLPVECVSWNDSQAFLAKLNAIVPGGGFRLPTEAEWEYACRAGTTSAYTGNLDEMAWCGKNSEEKTHAVGLKQPNAWGLYDMHGNVWEWCQDWSGVYPSGSVTDPTGPSSGSARVGRGGGWRDRAADCRAAVRAYGSPDYALSYLGFRVALPASQPRKPK